MITEERKNQLLGNLIDWATEVINDDEEIANVLHKSVGFTKEELEEFDVEIPDGYFDRTYPHIAECVDADYCMKTLSKEGLDYLEKVLSDFEEDKISLVIPRYDNDEVDFDGEWKVEVKDDHHEPSEAELCILKWYEGFEDIDYVCDEIESEVADIINEQKGGMGIVSEDSAVEIIEAAQKEDDDGVLMETYKVKTPEYIEFGDPWYKEFEPERIAQLMVNAFPRPTDDCRVVLTAEPSEDYADMFDCTMSIFIAPAAHIETYMQGCVYEGQEVNDRRIGVDTAKYLIDVDGAFDEIHTGADGHWGNHLKIGRNINGNEIVDCEIIRIYMPEEETMDSMRQRFRYFFSDAEQIENVKERYLEDIDDGGNSETPSVNNEPQM